MSAHYRDGLSIPKDEKKAFFWGLKAAEQDYPGGQYMVGTYYEKGIGVEQDYAEAAKWFRKAADQSNEYAQYELGECYREGKGVEKDMVEAVYRLAADQKNYDAKEALKELGINY